MRKLLAVATAFTAIGWLLGRGLGPAPEPPPAEPASQVDYDVTKLTRPGEWSPTLHLIRPAEEFRETDDKSQTVSRVRFEDKTFWVILTRRGDGISYYTVEVYAPTEDGKYLRCVEAESCRAGWIKPELDGTTGVLVVREHAKSTIEGQVILSCNLRSVGNYHSVFGK